MTPEIATVFGIIFVSLVLFMSERVRPDVVAVMVLLALTLSGILTPAEALSGFASPAVITVWAVFVLSGALYRTGVAGALGDRLLPMAAGSPDRLLALLMVCGGLLSAFMNNVGVVAMLLPVVMGLARRTRLPPSRLLMPLAQGALLGGLMTLIGTPPNILVADALRTSGLEPFSMFDFAPTGLPVLISGVLFMALVGKRLLPKTDVVSASSAPGLRALYQAGERYFVLQVPERSRLAGHTLAESRLGAALGLNVLAVTRGAKTLLAPPPSTPLRGGDRLVAEGPIEELELLRQQRPLKLSRDRMTLAGLQDRGLALAEIEVAPDSSFVGQTLREADWRRRANVIVLAAQVGARRIESNLAEWVVEPGALMAVVGTDAGLQAVRGAWQGVELRDTAAREVAEKYSVTDRLLVLGVVDGSMLDGRTLLESKIGDAFGMAVIAIKRGDDLELLPQADATLRSGDEVIAAVRPETMQTLRALRGLTVEREIEADLRALESAEIGLSAAVLSPYSRISGQTLRSIHFREKYGLNVVSVWREGQVLTRGLRDRELRFGDALLLHGPRERLEVLGSEPDFLVLDRPGRTPLVRDKAAIALAIMAFAFLLPVVAGVLEVAIAGLLGAILVVVSGCLTMDQAYRSVEWRAVFLTAGMLPLGLAMEGTGAVGLIADRMVELSSGLGPLGILSAFFLLATVASQIMPNAAVAVLLAPIAIRMAIDLSLSPYALAMTVAMAASASLISPVGHPANILVMGPGGYSFRDFVRVGLPLTVVVWLVTMLVVPLRWPLQAP